MKEAIGRARALARASVPSKMLVYSKDGLMRDYVTYGLRRIPQWPKGPNSERIEKAVVRLTIERLTSKDELARV